jgi:hypothetical protein
MGWCSVGTGGEKCDERSCEEIHGNYDAGAGGGGMCIVLSILEDPIARDVIRSLVYPPILTVRDEVLPQSPVGRMIVDDFDRHYEESVSILRKDPDLLNEVINFMTANVALAQALIGQPYAHRPATGWTPSTYISARLRPGTIDWFSQILERFRGQASEEFSASIRKYMELVPRLQDLTPTEILTEFRGKELLEVGRN